MNPPHQPTPNRIRPWAGFVGFRCFLPREGAASTRLSVRTPTLNLSPHFGYLFLQFSQVWRKLRGFWKNYGDFTLPLDILLPIMHAYISPGGNWYFKLTGVCRGQVKKMGAKERPIKEKEGLGNWPIKEKRGSRELNFGWTKYETRVRILACRPWPHARIQGHGRQRARRWAAQARGDAC